eukprot:971543-Prorocentrum_lima.AAC.1
MEDQEHVLRHWHSEYATETQGTLQRIAMLEELNRSAQDKLVQPERHIEAQHHQSVTRLQQTAEKEH